MHSIAIINGPNLNLLGIRQPNIYGSQSFDEYLKDLQNQYPNVDIAYYQSNIEGEIIDYLHKCMFKGFKGIVINAGAYTHTSIAIADAISSINLHVVEVHISNILAREEYRKQSYISSNCIGSISGLGLYGYKLAIDFLINSLNEN